MLDKLLSRKKPSSGLKLEEPLPDFIPYACHYDPDTILTKNGELLQVIKITGFSSESVGSEDLDLRETIRKAILDNVKNDSFSLWLHTIRRKMPLDPGGEFPDGFAKDLNKAWKDKNNWDEMYVNEVYITILYDGQSSAINNLSSLLSSLYFGALKRKHENYLSQSNKYLTETTNNFLKTLEPFGAKRLTILEENGVFYSEQLQFFAKIMHLKDEKTPMPISDISEHLSTDRIAFGFNTMETRGEGSKAFAALFTLKEYHELPINVLDVFIQIDHEFIITQTLDFINCKSALKDFKKQKYILNISKGDELSEAIGLDYIIAGDNKSPTAFGDSQITILLTNTNLKALEAGVAEAAKKLQHLGMVVVRRDLRLEECFWAQLPGNFAYVSRRNPVSTSLVGGFASLYNFPAGKRTGNLWGAAVTMFRTDFGTPYFFSFHEQNNGHTAIIGPLGMGKTVLLNFLVSESRKFNGRLFFFDQERASKVFIKSIGGHYTIIKPNEKSPEYGFNPLQIENTPENIKFLKKWLILLAESSGDPISEKEKDHLTKLVNYSFTLPVEQRRLSAFAKSFGTVKKGSLGEKMSPWHGAGKYAHLFDNDIKGVLKLDEMIYGFGMSHVVKDKISLAPILSYLFHRIEIALDGKPTVIVLDEAWGLVNNPILAPELSGWLTRLTARNAIVIFATETIPNDRENVVTNIVVNEIATQMFLPNIDADESSKAYKNVWGLSDDEFGMLSRMRAQKRNFMLRQGGNAIVAQLDLNGIIELEVLSGDDKTATMMESVIAEKGNNPKDWLPVFYEKIKN